MAVPLGLDCKLYRNTATYASPTWVLVENVRDLTQPLTADEADLTTRANAGWKATRATLKSGEISWGMVYDTADADFEAIREAFMDNTPIELLALDGPQATAGSQGLRATYSITKFEKSEPLAEAVTVEVTAKITYAANPPAWYTAS